MSDQILRLILARAQRSQQPGECPLSAFGRERAAYELEHLLRLGVARGDITVTVDSDGELRWSATA